MKHSLSSNRDVQGGLNRGDGCANLSSDADGVGDYVPNREHGLESEVETTRWEGRENKTKKELECVGAGICKNRP